MRPSLVVSLKYSTTVSNLTVSSYLEDLHGERTVLLSTSSELAISDHAADLISEDFHYKLVLNTIHLFVVRDF